MKRPDHCLTCPLKGTGFVGDTNPPQAKAAFVFRCPTKEDLIWKEPMTGKGGRAWEHRFLHPLGLTRHDVVLTSVFRCFPPGGESPTEPTFTGACRHCRHYDGVIDSFKPTVWGIGLNPMNLIKTPNQETFVRREMERVGQFISEGERPVLLCGEEARRKYAPWLDGPLKRYRGYWFSDKERKAV